MQRLSRHNRKNDVILAWFAPLGQAARLAADMVYPGNLLSIQFGQYRSCLRWMGIESLPLVGLSAMLVSLALTIQTIIELKNFSAQDMAGMVICTGLLRELGPLTVSASWCARVAARLSGEAHEFSGNAREFASQFALPKYLAALSMAIPLGGYGLVIGFLTSAFFAPYLGVSSTHDYLSATKPSIKDKDLFCYFFKLILVNPSIGVFTGCVFGRYGKGGPAEICSNAVTAFFIAAMFFNFVFTYAMYMP